MGPAGELLDDLHLDLPDRRSGKVRVSYALPADERGRARRLFVTTDRLSAFDRIVGLVRHKGQVLNQLSWWWFTGCADLVAHHGLAVPDPNALVALEARPLPVEVVVRGAITGVTSTSLWTRYEAGARLIDGHRLPDGLRKHDLLPRPLVTPTTKAPAGGHDLPLSCAEVVERGLVEPVLWDEVVAVALAVFERGVTRARHAGLILADTKFEFGLAPDGTLLLIDEVLTPDSSRYWDAASYEARRAAGEEPESFDKEDVRRALAAAGFRGEGPVPDLGPTVWADTSARYVALYERLTGAPFVPGDTPVADRVRRNVEALVCAA